MQVGIGSSRRDDQSSEKPHDGKPSPTDSPESPTGGKPETRPHGRHGSGVPQGFWFYFLQGKGDTAHEWTLHSKTFWKRQTR
jgi:hypothetical protein